MSGAGRRSEAEARRVQMPWVHSDAHRQHDPAIEVWTGTQQPSTEIPARADAIAASLAGDHAFRPVTPRPHGLDPVLAVHEEGLVRCLEQIWDECRPLSPTREVFPDTVLHPAMLSRAAGRTDPAAAPSARLGYWCFDTMTPIVAGTYAAARAAADCALTAVDLVLAGERSAYALCRPPGHHAGRRVMGGFCYLNNAAIAARQFTESAGRPVAILDLDYHHGNGTQQIFYECGDVIYASLHANPGRAFPYFTGYPDETGYGDGLGSTLNVPLPARCDDDEYIAHLQRILEFIAGRRAAAVVVSLGVDTYERDPICDLAITTGGYLQMGHLVADLGLPAVIVQEGGYYLPDLGVNVREWLRGFLGLPAAAEPESVA